MSEEGSLGCDKGEERREADHQHQRGVIPTALPSDAASYRASAQPSATHSCAPPKNIGRRSAPPMPGGGDVRACVERTAKDRQAGRETSHEQAS